MADLRLNRIANAVQDVERVNENRMNGIRFYSMRELSDRFHTMSSDLFYMNKFGIISDE